MIEPPSDTTIVFVVIVVGGLGSLKGALVASILIGVLQTTAISLDLSINSLIETLGFAVDLERVGFYIVRNLPLINYHRLEVLSLTSMEEYDKLMLEMKGPANGLRR